MNNRTILNVVFLLLWFIFMCNEKKPNRIDHQVVLGDGVFCDFENDTDEDIVMYSVETPNVRMEKTLVKKRNGVLFECSFVQNNDFAIIILKNENSTTVIYPPEYKVRLVRQSERRIVYEYRFHYNLNGKLEFY